MAKTCAGCGKNIGPFAQKVQISDGLVCTDCWKKIGYNTKKKDLDKAARYSSSEIAKIISGEVRNPVDVAAEFEKQISAAIKANGTGIGFLGKGTHKDIAEMLRADEVFIDAINANVSVAEPQGKIKANLFNLKDKKNGDVVLTDQRLVYTTGDNLASKIIYLEDITAIDDKASLVAGSVLRVQTNSTVMAIDGTPKILSMFRKKIEESVHVARSSRNQGGTVVMQQTSAADELLKFKQLMDAGVITEEEFNAKKQQLLGL